MNTKVTIHQVPEKRRNEILRAHKQDERRTKETLTIEITEQGKNKFMAEFRRKDGTLAAVI